MSEAVLTSSRKITKSLVPVATGIEPQRGLPSLGYDLVFKLESS